MPGMGPSRQSWSAARTCIISTYLLVVMDGAAFAAQDVWRAPIEAAELENPIEAGLTSLKAGEKAFLRHCTACHDSGNGAATIGLGADTVDFSAVDLSGQTDGELFWKISTGRRTMPGFGRRLGIAQGWNLVNYLRSISPQRRAMTRAPAQASAPDDRP
jgi:mono/diheme cytochrome c family protein